MLRKTASITNQGRRLNDLIERLLDVSRIATGRLSIKPQHVDLVPVIQEVIATHKPQAEQAGSSVRLISPPSVMGFGIRCASGRS